MSLRPRLSSFALVVLFALAPVSLVSAADTKATAEVAETEAEARRLYDHANDFVSSIEEGGYSYAYLQFHWKRAQSNIDRVLRVYPNTATGRALKSSQLKIGPYELAYFKDRVLPRLEEKRIAAFDSINCAIFLAETRGEAWDEPRRQAVVRIIEALSRQKRWNEALKFPVLDSDRALKHATVFRIAARFEQQDLIKQLLAVTPKENLSQIHGILGEALALRGLPRTEIAALLDQDPSDVVKLAVLSGMIQREVQIQRSAALRLPADRIMLIGDALKRPEVRDDVNAVAKTFFPAGNPVADDLLAQYRAALGEQPKAQASVGTQLAYLEYLSAAEKFDELSTYAAKIRLPKPVQHLVELKLIELLAQAGRVAESERLRARYAAADNTDAATLAQFRGQMNSLEAPLTIHEKSFANLPFKDPCVLAQAMMEWSLTPNRSIRGAAPYDAVVHKFAPGFENLAAAKSTAVRDAANTQKPY
jgi:hypothetical protein